MQRARSAQSRLPQRRGSNSRELRHERRSFVTARLGYLKRRWNPGFATLVGRRVGRGCVLARELLQLYDRHYAHPTSFSRLPPPPTLSFRLLTLLSSLTQSFPRGYENMWVFVGIGPLWCCRVPSTVSWIGTCMVGATINAMCRVSVPRNWFLILSLLNYIRKRGIFVTFFKNLAIVNVIIYTSYFPSTEYDYPNR